MSKEQLSSHPDELDQAAAQQAYEAWVVNEPEHNQALKSSIGDIIKAKENEKKSRAERDKAAKKADAAEKLGEIAVTDYDKAASNPAEILAKAGVMPRGAVGRETAKVAEAPTETPAEVSTQLGQPSNSPNVNLDFQRNERNDDVIAEGIRKRELEKAMVSAYDSMPEKLQREMNARGRRHAMEEFDLSSDRKVAKLSRTDHARYQQFLDRAAQLTYQAANEYKQKLAHVDQVMSEMGLDGNAKLSDLTVDKQIELASQVSKSRDHQPRPSERRNANDVNHDEKGGAKSGEKRVASFADDVTYEAPDDKQANQAKKTPYILDMDDTGVDESEVDRIMDEIHRNVAREREVDQIMKEIHQNVDASGPRVRVVPLDPNKQSTTEPQVKVVPLDPNAQPAQQQPDAEDSQPEPEPKPEPPVIASEAINFNPMAAISIDREQMADDAAQQAARERLNKELSTEYWTEKDDNGKPLHRFGRIKAAATRLWKGNIWRGYYERKYQRLEREKYQGIESLDMKDENGKLLSNEELLEKAKTDARYALILRMGQDNERYIYSRAGETREQLGEGDEAYDAMAKVLRDFVAKDKDGKWLMSTETLNEELKRIRALQHDIDLDSKLGQMEFKKLATLDNYEAIAMYVRSQVEHGEALDDVIKGFKMYTAESREGARTETYRTLVEDTIDRFQHTKAGQFIPAEWVATAAGAAGWVVGAVAKNKAVQIASLGGSTFLAGGLAAVKESNAVKVDRTTMARQLATGAVDDSGIEQKYSDEIQSSMYDMARADQLIQGIDRARESGDFNEMKAALDEVILRQAISDSDGIDLIRYSSPEAVESERVALLTHQLQLEADYIAAARQRDPNFNFDDYRERLLSIVDQMPAVNDDVLIDKSGRDFARTMLIESGAAMPEEVLERGKQKSFGALSSVPSEQLAKIYDDIRARDKAFAKLKRRRVIGAGLKTAAVSFAFSAGFQEVVAYTNDNIRGVLEGLSGENADATSTTTLEGLRSHVANMFGLEQAAGVAGEATVGTTRHIAAHGVSEEQLQEWRDKGYDVQSNHAMVNELQTKTVSASEAVQNNAHVSRAGWFDNGTRASDLGELSGHNTGSGYVYHIANQYSSSNGLLVSGEQMLQTARDGNLKLLISPTSGTQMNPFEITGHVEGSQVVFDVAQGSPEAQMLASGSFHTAEVFDASNNMVLATEVGSGTADSLTTTVTEAVNQVVSYDVTAPGLAADVVSTPGVVEVEPPLPFVYPPVGHNVIQTLTYNSPSYISQTPPNINPTMTPWEMALNRFRQSKVGRFVEDAAKDKVEDAAQSVITGAANYLAALSEEIPVLNAEMTVGMINESLDEFRTKFGLENLKKAFGDLIVTEGKHTRLSKKAEDIIAGNIATFNDDIMRQMSLRADSYLRKNPAGADRSLPNDVRLASLVWATGDMLQQYAGESLGGVGADA